MKMENGNLPGEGILVKDVSIHTFQFVTIEGHFCNIAGTRFNANKRIRYAGYCYSPIRGPVFL